MRWAVEWGPYAEAIEARQEQTGSPAPSIDNRPELYDDLYEIWLAFCELSETRPVGFGPGAISFAEIEAWLRLHEIDDVDSVADYTYLIRVVDREWLARQGKKYGDNGKSDTGH